MDKELNNKFDNFLRIYSLKKNNEQLNQIESDMVFLSAQEVEMPENLKEELIDKLYEVIKINSLGELIVDKVNERNILNTELASVSGLTEDIISGIRNDTIFPNSVPIKSLKKLLIWLGLEFEQTENAIRKTFKILMNEIGSSDSYHIGIQPSYRRQNNSGLIKERDKYSDSRASKLYRNEGALEKYINRLGELYND